MLALHSRLCACRSRCWLLHTRPSFRTGRLLYAASTHWLASRAVSERNVIPWARRVDLGAKGCCTRLVLLTSAPENTRGEIAHQYTAREPRHSSAKVTTQAARPPCCMCAPVQMTDWRCLIGLT
jgi:hypothetical protein